MKLKTSQQWHKKQSDQRSGTERVWLARLGVRIIKKKSQPAKSDTIYNSLKWLNEGLITCTDSNNNIAAKLVLKVFWQYFPLFLQWTSYSSHPLLTLSYRYRKVMYIHCTRYPWQVTTTLVGESGMNISELPHRWSHFDLSKSALPRSCLASYPAGEMFV